MGMLSIEKINNVFLRVFGSDDGIEQELSEFFKFRVEGYKFMEAYKKGIWDGYIRLYNLHTKTLYIGLLQYIQKFAHSNGYEIDYINEVVDINPVTMEEIVEFSTALNVHTRGKPISAKGYQLDAIYKAIHDKRILLLSPTASGKSFIIYNCLRYLVNQGKKIILIVPSTGLVKQMYADFEDYSSENGWDVDGHCQQLYSGFTKVIEKQILITTWQSIYKMPVQWFKQFDAVFGDEAHEFASKSLTNILESLNKCDYRVATTGTLHDTKTHKLVLEGLFGTVYTVTTTRELIDSNDVSDLKIKCLLLKHPKENIAIAKGLPYKSEMDFLVNNANRNKFIRNLAISTKGTTLVLFQFVEHGKELYELIKARVGDTKPVYFISGSVKVDKREEIRLQANNEPDAIILASYGTTQRGVNIPAIENVIFASPAKSKVRNLQSIGRGLRLKDGKQMCRLFDISDDLTYRKTQNHTLKHLLDRIRIYTLEKFDFTLHEVPFK